MATEPIECQDVVLRVPIHCQGCKKKVKKVLQNVGGVYRCEIDARTNKVVATVSKKLDPYMLVAKLRKSGKQAELWPEQPVQPPPPPPAAESQSQEPKNKQPDEPSKPNDTAEAAVAEPSNPQPSPPEPKQSTGGEAPNPAAQDSKENASADDAGDETPAAPAPAPAPAQQGPSSEAKGKAKARQHPEMEERQPMDARVTVEYDHRGGVGGGYVNRSIPVPPPAVMSYNQVRPSVSASYYAPAPAPAPAPMPLARPGPSQGYIDEHYTPSYYNNSNNYNRSPAAYEPYYYSTPQPAPYSYQYQYQPAASSEDYYYSAPPQRSAFSPPRDGYGDMFNDENANSCTVM